GGRGSAQIDGDVEHAAADDAHQLSLRLPDLIMQPAQHAARGAGMIVLDEAHVEVRGGTEPVLVPALQEKTALIAEHLRLADEDIGDRRGHHVHDTARSCSSARRSRYWP